MKHPIFCILILVFMVISNAELIAEEKKALSAGSYKVISRAQDLIQKKQPKQAIQKLRALLPKIKKQAYDTAVAFQTLGYAFYEANDRKNAKIAFIKAVELNVLPNEVNQQLEYNILQMYTFDEDYKQAEAYLNKWLAKKPKLNKDANLLAATIYYNQKKYKKMIPYVQSAIKQSKSFDSSLYQLLAAAYIETKAYNKAAKIYETFLSREPNNKSHWLQLISIYQLANQYKKSLSTSELAYKKGILNDEKQIINLANNYLYNKIPLKSAELLDKEISTSNIRSSKKNIELLANSWILAQEEKKAISVLKQYLSRNNDPDMQFRLGQLYYEVNDWQNAIKTLQQFKNNSTKHVSLSKALMLLGISAYEENDYTLSKNAFTQAARYKDSRNDAQLWLKQIESLQSANNTITETS